MHITPVSIARPKLSNSSAIASASPTEVWITPGGRCLQARQRQGRLLDVAQGARVQLDLEIDVAQAVVAGDLGRAALDLDSVATLDSGTGPRAPGTGSRASRSRSCRAPSSRRTTIGTWRWLRLSLARPWS